MLADKRTLFANPTPDIIRIVHNDAAFWHEEATLLHEIGTENALKTSKRLRDILARDKACQTCDHDWSQHKRIENGAYACTYHGCGCRDGVP